jgi:glutathione S-transferase
MESIVATDDDPAAITEMQRKVPQSVVECFDLIEHDTLKGPWVMGETYAIRDPYLFTVAQWLESDGVDQTGFPKVIERWRRMSDRPAVRNALAEEQR